MPIHLEKIRRRCALGALSALPWLAYAQQKKLQLVFIPKSSDQVFWDLMRQGVDRAVREDGAVQLTWRGPAHNDDTDAQIRILQVYTRPDVDAILITPTDRARLAEPVRAASALGIQVVVVDSALDGNAHVNLVATDNLRGGRLAAKRMAELLGRQGRVLVLRTVAGSASTDERAEGFKAYLKENAPKISVVADEHGGGSTGRALHSALALLKKYPAVDGVFAVNESATEGMLRALRESGQAGRIRFIGFDATELLLRGLEDQEIHGLVIQNPQQMGYLAVKAALAAARKTPLPDRTLYTDTTLVTSENMHAPHIRRLMCVQC
jgi:ribose transport system substrate-binding protein